jgi:hypothetical protein
LLSTYPQPVSDFLRSFTSFRWKPDHFYRKILALSKKLGMKVSSLDASSLRIS